MGEAILACVYIISWICLSAGVILFNKYILTTLNFPFPVTLTMIHMAFCSSLAFVIVRVLKLVEAVHMERGKYINSVVPIGMLFAVVLCSGNSAYLYLSVSFIQMVKAIMPCVVYTCGILFKLEKFKARTMMNMLVISVGVAIASYGELNFHLTGFVLLLGSIFAEALRLIGIQVLLTRADIKLNSITTLYYVSPVCFVFLIIPFIAVELPELRKADLTDLSAAVLFGNALLAFALNISVFLLIGKTSALTMNVAGVVKDWLLIYTGSIIFASPVSELQLLGYLLAFGAVCSYNYTKLKQSQATPERPSHQGKA